MNSSLILTLTWVHCTVKVVVTRRTEHYQHRQIHLSLIAAFKRGAEPMLSLCLSVRISHLRCRWSSILMIFAYLKFLWNSLRRQTQGTQTYGSYLFIYLFMNLLLLGFTLVLIHEEGLTAVWEFFWLMAGQMRQISSRRKRCYDNQDSDRMSASMAARTSFVSLKARPLT